MNLHLRLGAKKRFALIFSSLDLISVSSPVFPLRWQSQLSHLSLCPRGAFAHQGRGVRLGAHLVFTLSVISSFWFLLEVPSPLTSLFTQAVGEATSCPPCLPLSGAKKSCQGHRGPRELCRLTKATPARSHGTVIVTSPEP